MESCVAEIKAQPSSMLIQNVCIVFLGLRSGEFFQDDWDDTYENIGPSEGNSETLTVLQTV